VSEPLVYLNGHLVPASQAHLAIFDCGVVFGATVTEMTRTFAGKLFRLDDHLDRLFASLACVRFDIGLTQEALGHISHELVEHNARLLDAGGELGLIHFVTAGEYPTYAGMSGRAARTGPTVCIHTFPLPFAQWADRMRRGAHLITPTIRHVPPQCYEPAMKYRSRLHFYLADQEARRSDSEASALLLDLAGNVTETPAANFLIVERGAIVSPKATNILAGISRQTVFELADAMGIPHLERDLTVDNVTRADEALLTGTPYCLLPVTRVNGGPIGDGQPGPIFEQLLGAWSEKVGLDIRQQIFTAASGA